MDLDEPHTSFSKNARSDLIYITEQPYDAQIQPAFDYSSVVEHDPVICIDNGTPRIRRPAVFAATVANRIGSSSWRAGFSGSAGPYIDRPNTVSKYKERKLGRNTMLFGRDIEVDANAKSSARSMYDGDLLVHGDILVSPSIPRAPG
jgi:actin-related protein 5